MEDKKTDRKTGKADKKRVFRGEQSDRNNSASRGEQSDRNKPVSRRKPGSDHRPGRLLPLLFLIAVAGVVCIWRLTPTRKKADPAVYFAEKMREAGAEDPENTTLEELLKGDALAVVLEDTVDARPAFINEGVLYLPLGLATDYLNDNFYWDEELQRMIFTTPLEICEIPVESAVWVSDAADGGERTWKHEILIRRNGDLYVSSEFLQEYTNVEYILPEDGCHVLIHSRWGSHQVTDAFRNTPVRTGAGIHEKVLTVVPAGEMLEVLSIEKRWLQVVSPDGYIGYVRKSRKYQIEEREIQREFDGPVYTSTHLDENVRLVWHQIDNADMNSYLERDTENMTGVNVISPTWFAMTDNEGHFLSLADASYVSKAHEMGLQVWGLINNFSPEVSTYQTLSTFTSRNELEYGLIQAAEDYGLDGINIDLEAITEDSAPGYVQFLREMSVLCRRRGLVLSVDVPVPMSFNQYYNRKELGEVCDYVIVMGYDEHYYGSEAGSVASLEFEENGIRDTLTDVPADKIVTGVPFYTRVWYTRVQEDGSESVASEILTMKGVAQLLEESGAAVEWDESTGQNYAGWTDSEGTFCQIWIEDAKSLALKAELEDTYGIGGIAAWVLGNETDDIWEILS